MKWSCMHIHLYIIHMSYYLLTSTFPENHSVKRKSVSFIHCPRASFSRENDGEDQRQTGECRALFPLTPWSAMLVHSHAAFSATVRIIHWGTGLPPPSLTFWPHSQTLQHLPTPRNWVGGKTCGIHLPGWSGLVDHKYQLGKRGRGVSYRDRAHLWAITMSIRRCHHEGGPDSVSGFSNR